MIKNLKIKNKGITLIALVITIIVLLILAGVTIAMLTGENGILNQANEAKNKTEQATIEEQKKLAQTEANLNLEEKEYKDSTGKKAIIPAGFSVSYREEEKQVDKGLVIIDEQGNEFVFIPVDDANEMYGTLADGKKAGKLYNFTSSGYTANNWTETNEVMNITAATKDRESDIVTSYDNNTSYNNGLFTKETLQQEFDKMIESVIKYKGFYIGRYELSLDSNKKVESKKGKTSSNASQADTKMWYGLYAKAKTYTNKNNTNIKSGMIWGCQWDAMLRWMQANSIDVSSANGASKNTTRIAGNVETDKLNNIYDILGNSCEWTLEAFSTNRRSYRSGNYASNSSPSNRFSDDSNSAYSYDGSRFVLY